MIFVDFDQNLYAIGKDRRQAESVYLGSMSACFNVLDPTEHLNDPSLPDLFNQSHCMPYPKADWSYIDCKDEDDEAVNHMAGNNSKFWNDSFMCHSRCQNITVLNKLNIFQRRMATLPAWIFFNRTSTDCFKTVNDSEVWHFANGCTRAGIIEYARNHTYVHHKYERDG